jgi:hypothetical protein
VSRIAWLLAALAVSVVLGCAPAVWSVSVHRQVPISYGNECAAARESPKAQCFAPGPAGGWPFPFLFDTAISPQNRLSWLTDEFRLRWFLADAAVFGAVPVAGILIFRLRRRRRRRLAAVGGSCG